MEFGDAAFLESPCGSHRSRSDLKPAKPSCKNISIHLRSGEVNAWRALTVLRIGVKLNCCNEEVSVSSCCCSWLIIPNAMQNVSSTATQCTPSTVAGVAGAAGSSLLKVLPRGSTCCRSNHGTNPTGAETAGSNNNNNKKRFKGVFKMIVGIRGAVRPLVAVASASRVAEPNMRRS